MSSTRLLRRPWAVALVILLISGGAAPAQTKPSVATAIRRKAVVDETRKSLERALASIRPTIEQSSPRN